LRMDVTALLVIGSIRWFARPAADVSDPRRITPTINHREYRDILIWIVVIDREWEGFAKQAVIIHVRDSMCTPSNFEALNVRLDRAQKVVSKPDLLRFVKVVSLV